MTASLALRLLRRSWGRSTDCADSWISIERTFLSEVRRIEPGDAVYIPANAIQFLHNYGNEPIVFVCLVDPAWRKEDETIYPPV
ncbi:hypothetical protein [Scytonema sp. PCC 10023]|uniref:hypothetical protein n=1 Tax=Scytonema sp. PCC 10023 TaxID=1680591 RepID=UPI0039C5DD73